jgi:hypothetical protein
MKYQQTMSIFLLFVIFCSISSILSKKPFKDLLEKISKGVKNNKSQDKTITTTSIYMRETGSQPSDELAINLLDRHIINCDKRQSAINSFRMVKNGKKKEIKYEYTCVQSPMITNNCRKHKTNMADTSFHVRKTLDSLVKHYVECPSNTVMKLVKLVPHGNFHSGFKELFRLNEKEYPFLHYEYTCCEASIERTIWATTRRTSNRGNSYLNLKSQRVEAHDNNAISSFHMQCPQGTIFYEMRISQLKGQESPFYPDYLKDNSKNPGENLESTLKPKDTQNSNGNSPSDKPAFVGK